MGTVINLLDFRRGKPERFGLDLHDRRGELRQDVHRHLGELPDAGKP